MILFLISTSINQLIKEILWYEDWLFRKNSVDISKDLTMANLNACSPPNYPFITELSHTAQLKAQTASITEH